MILALVLTIYGQDYLTAVGRPYVCEAPLTTSRELGEHFYASELGFLSRFALTQESLLKTCW